MGTAEDWATKVGWMRSAHAVEAEWHPDGSLARVVLGPEDAETHDEVATGMRQESEEEKQVRSLAERRTRFGAVSGLRKRE